MASFDLIIKNGEIFDGTGAESFRADVGITGGVIRAVGALASHDARQTIAADGFFVAPGFIDVQNHSDSYLTMLETPALPSLVSQGITTIAVGHCGTSLAPLSSPDALKSVQKWRSLAGANINWSYFSEYAEILEKYPLGPNVMSLIGHATVRRGIMGDQVRAATTEEIGIIRQMTEKGLDSGGAGVSLGLVYAHEANSTQEELLSVAKLVASKEKLLSVHLRSEGSNVVSALEEVIDLAEKSGARLKVSHFKIREPKNYHYLDEALAVMDRAYQKGTDIFFDIYPYTTSWTVLYTYLPKWSYEGGKSAILKNIRDRGNRGKILSYLAGQEQDLGRVFIATSETTPAFTGKTLSQVAANQEVVVGEALLNVLEATNTHVIVFDHNLSEDMLLTLLKHPLSVIGTDGAGYDFSYSATQGLVHPRCFGTMPKFLSLVRERKIMTWAEAIKKITSRPAEKMKLTGRGKIAQNAVADLVVFDPRTIGSRATYENPYQQADGIEHVVIGGVPVFSARDGLTQTTGKFLKL